MSAARHACPLAGYGPAGRARPSTARWAARSVVVRPAAGQLPDQTCIAPPEAACLNLFRGLFGNIRWGTECAQGTGAIRGRPPAMSTCSPYAGPLLDAGWCEPHQGQTADIDS
jgi:hypothetical protein